MKKLAILGASYLQLPLVLKANEMGLETHCFAWDNDEAVCKKAANYFYPISVLNKEEILEKCREIGIDGITTIATDICVPVICYVARELGLISNSYQSGVMATNKARMRKAFDENNVNSPRSISTTEFDKGLFEKLAFPLIVKPTDRSGSRGVAKVFNMDELEQAINRALGESLEKKAVIEEFIQGEEVSVESISWKGKHYILTITDKVTTGEPYFVELEHHQPSGLPENVQNDIRTETFKALNALDIKFGAGHSEFKITEDGKVMAIEVGARMGGDFIGSHLVELSTGYDFLKGVINVALDQFEEPSTETENYSGVYFLSKDSEFLKPYFEKENDFDFEKKLLINELSYISNSSDRSGYLIYRSKQKINLK